MQEEMKPLSDDRLAQLGEQFDRGSTRAGGWPWTYVELQRLVAELQQRRAAAPVFPFSEENCPNHVASSADPKVCGRCGIHIDSLRPDDDEVEP